MMRSRDRPVGFSRCPVVPQITLSSVSDVDCCHALCSETVLTPLNVRHSDKILLLCIKTEVSCFLCFILDYSVFLLLVVSEFLETSRRFALQSNSDVRDNWSRQSGRLCCVLIRCTPFLKTFWKQAVLSEFTHSTPLPIGLCRLNTLTARC